MNRPALLILILATFTSSPTSAQTPVSLNPYVQRQNELTALQVGEQGSIWLDFGDTYFKSREFKIRFRNIHLDVSGQITGVFGSLFDGRTYGNVIYLMPKEIHKIRFGDNREYAHDPKSHLLVPVSWIEAWTKARATEAASIAKVKAEAETKVRLGLEIDARLARIAEHDEMKRRLESERRRKEASDRNEARIVAGRDAARREYEVSNRPEKISLVVSRESKFLGNLSNQHVYVNGKYLGAVESGTSKAFPITPNDDGKYSLNIRGYGSLTGDTRMFSARPGDEVVISTTMELAAFDATTIKSVNVFSLKHARLRLASRPGGSPRKISINGVEHLIAASVEFDTYEWAPTNRLIRLAILAEVGDGTREFVAFVKPEKVLELHQEARIGGEDSGFTPTERFYTQILSCIYFNLGNLGVEVADRLKNLADDLGRLDARGVSSKGVAFAGALRDYYRELHDQSTGPSTTERLGAIAKEHVPVEEIVQSVVGAGVLVARGYLFNDIQPGEWSQFGIEAGVTAIGTFLWNAGGQLKNLATGSYNNYNTLNVFVTKLHFP